MQNKADAQDGLAAVHCEDVSVSLTVDIKHTAHAPQAREEKKKKKTQQIIIIFRKYKNQSAHNVAQTFASKILDEKCKSS